MRHRVAERVRHAARRNVRDRRRLGRRDRHHVVRRKRDRGRSGSRRNRHGLRERILAGSVGHRVLVFRMGVAVVLPLAVRGDHLQFLRGSRDFQRTRNTCNVVVRRHIVVGGILDLHAVLRNDNRIFANRRAGTRQCNICYTLTVDQCAARNRVVRTLCIGRSRIGNLAARVLVRRVVSRQLERSRRDRLRQIVNNSVITNALRGRETARSTSQGCASCIGISTNIRTVRSDHTGRDSIPVHQTSHLIIRIGGGIGAREHRAVVNLLGIQGDGQLCSIHLQLTIHLYNIIVAGHIRLATHHFHGGNGIGFRTNVSDGSCHNSRHHIVVRERVTRGGISCSYSVALVTESNRVACIRMLLPVIGPSSRGSRRHRQSLGDLLHSLVGSNLTTLAVGHGDGVIAVGKVADSVCSIAKGTCATVGRYIVIIPSHRIVRSSGSQIQGNETIRCIVALAVVSSDFHRRFRIDRHRGGRCCRTGVTILESHRNRLLAHRVPLSRDSVVFPCGCATLAKSPHIIAHATLRGEAEGDIGLGGVDTDLAAREGRDCQGIHHDSLGSRRRASTAVSVLVVHRHRLAAWGSPFQRNGIVSR